MKHIRGIHLLFILLLVASIGCFWLGFGFGKESQRQADLVSITEASLEGNKNNNHTHVTKASKGHGDDHVENITEDKTNPPIAIEGDIIDSFTDESKTVDSLYEHPLFCLKETEGYVSVFVFSTGELYFETDVLISDLPYELQEDLVEGIEFYSLEHVYLFLENYSS